MQVKREKSFVVHLTGFHSNVEKIFTGLASFVLKVLKKVIVMITIGKTCAFCQKPMKSMKLFSRLTFVVYGMPYKFTVLYFRSNLEGTHSYCT